MKNPIGFGVAIMATASLVFAGGEGEKKGGEGATATQDRPATMEGWTGAPGRGITFTSENFKIRLKNQLQILFEYSNIDTGPDVVDFDIRRARTDLSGYIWNENLTYKLQNEWDSATSIKDAWIDWRFHNTDDYDMGVRGGQLKTRFGREHNTSSSKLEFVDRALATQAFTGTRSRGGFLHGSSKAGDGRLAWSVGVSTTDPAGGAINSGEEGDPRGLDNADNELNYTFDVSFVSDPKLCGMGSHQGNLDPSKTGWGAGAAIFLGNAQASAAGPDVETQSYNVWGEWKGNGIAVSGEYFGRTEEPDGGTDADAMGFQLAVTYTLPKVENQAQFGFGLRYSMVDADAGLVLLGPTAADTELSQIELGATMYNHGHDLKTQVSISQFTTEVGATDFDDILFALQTTLIF